jgi:hypothetical protein
MTTIPFTPIIFDETKFSKSGYKDLSGETPVNVLTNDISELLQNLKSVNESEEYYGVERDGRLTLTIKALQMLQERGLLMPHNNEVFYDKGAFVIDNTTALNVYYSEQTDNQGNALTNTDFWSFAFNFKNLLSTIQNSQTAIQELQERGLSIPWDADRNYYQGAIVIDNPTDMNVYFSKIPNNKNNPVTDISKWQFSFSLKQQQQTTELKQVILSNNTTNPNNAIDFASGVLFFDGFGQVSVPAITKLLNTNWTAGTNQGGLDTGTKQSNTWYYCYAIYNPTTQISDVIFSTNLTSPTLPTGFTKNKYIGAVKTNGSGNIIAFEHLKNNYFEYITPILEFSGTTPLTRTPLSVSSPVNVIVRINAKLNSVATAGTQNQLYLTDLNKTDSTSVVKLSANVNFNAAGEFDIKSNSNSQIGIRGNGSSGSVEIYTLGYFDINI